jgi:hypothetical protein
MVSYDLQPVVIARKTSKFPVRFAGDEWSEIGNPEKEGLNQKEARYGMPLSKHYCQFCIASLTRSKNPVNPAKSFNRV